MEKKKRKQKEVKEKEKEEGEKLTMLSNLICSDGQAGFPKFNSILWIPELYSSYWPGSYTMLV